AVRLPRPPRHADAAAQLAHVPHQLRLAREHLPRRVPVWPFLLVGDIGGAGPAKTLAADADAVAHRPAAALDQIEEMVRRIDHDRAWRLVAGVRHGLAQEGRVDVGELYRRDRKPVVDRRVHGAILPDDRGIDRPRRRPRAPPPPPRPAPPPPPPPLPFRPPPP